MISAKVIADSKNEFGNRITTMVVTFPRIILAEFNTHRMFSRNSASSRAIPFEKMVKSVEENPFIPIAWQKDHKGMQGIEYLDERESRLAVDRWKQTATFAVHEARILHGDSKWAVNETEMPNLGVTKQLCNRLLEPFMWHTVIVTATEWENFFELRCPKYALFSENMPMEFRSKKDLIAYADVVDKDMHHYDILGILDWLQCNKGQAEIHMMALAEEMWDAYNESQPKQLTDGEWHIPFGDNIDESKFSWLTMEQVHGTDPETFIEIMNKEKIKIATARCARVSYTTVGEEDKKDNYENDIKLHDRLAASGHWSPFEHCAKAMSGDEAYCRDSEMMHYKDECDKDEVNWSGNFRGFTQYRKTFEKENITR